MTLRPVPCFRREALQNVDHKYYSVAIAPVAAGGRRRAQGFGLARHVEEGQGRLRRVFGQPMRLSASKGVEAPEGLLPSRSPCAFEEGRLPRRNIT